MSSLTYIEKERIAKFFGFKGGYVFTFLKNGYNKTTTRDMILAGTGIDIYNDPDYDMSQERCFRAIWENCDDYTVGKLLNTMLDYYWHVADWSWEKREEIDYQELRKIAERLMNTPVIIPSAPTDTLRMVKEDIERNCNSNTPELALDRLHTFATEFFRNICSKHDVETVDDRGNELPLHSLVGKIKRWYADTGYFESDFCVIAIQNTINIFERFNAIRNDHSAAHPNSILNKAEALYAVRIVAETLTFIDRSPLPLSALSNNSGMLMKPTSSNSIKRNIRILRESSESAFFIVNSSVQQRSGQQLLRL